MIKALGVICVLFFVLAACSRESADEKQVKDVIMRYNQLLAEGYKNLNMNPLQEAATTDQAQKAYFHMAALGEGRVRMESTLKKIKFTDFTIQQLNKATVKTKEVWDFRHINLDTKQTDLEEKDFEYDLTYELVKEGGRWLVANVIAAEEDNPGRTSQPRPAQGRFSSLLREKQGKLMGVVPHP